jgi:hypothetical protein
VSPVDLSEDQVVPSAGLVFVAHADYHAFEVTRHSSRTYSHVMHTTLMTAIRAGMRFDEDDFFVMANKLHGSSWWGAEVEQFYSEAVRSGNRTACQAYERFKARRPFFRDGKRLCVGSTIQVEGKTVRLTSFHKDGQSAVFCHYKGGRPVKRTSLTREEVKSGRKRPALPKAGPGVMHFFLDHKDVFWNETTRKHWRKSQTLKEAWYWCQDFHALKRILEILKYEGSYIKVLACRTAEDIKTAVAWEELEPLFEPYTKRRKKPAKEGA